VPVRLRKRSKEPEPPKVPGYIVTFSDMVTLLLTFFVMLLSLAKEQDPELFNQGRDSFIESLRSGGLGIFAGRQDMPEFGADKPRYSVPEVEETTQRRTIDAEAERIRRIVRKISQNMAIDASKIAGQKVDFSITNIHFPPGRAELTDQARDWLEQYCRNLREYPLSKPLELCVVGLARDGRNDRHRWMLSAQRAETVARFIGKTLPAQCRWHIYSWGAGEGKRWVKQTGQTFGQLHILIALVRGQ